MHNLIKKIPLWLIVFFMTWGVYTALINSNDLHGYALQQLGAESLIERGQVNLQGSSTAEFLYTDEDTFVYNGALYAQKQPGQFFAGAGVYLVLNTFGITYADSYLLVSGLVTMLTTSLFAAIVVVLVYSWSARVSGSMHIGLAIAGLFGFGTLWLPYSGVAHHDVFAGSLVFIAFYCLYRKYRSTVKCYQAWLVAAGLCLGLAPFFSLLIASSVLVGWIYLLLFKQWRDVAWFGAAFIIGLLPTLSFNWLIFNGILNFANIVGGATDTLPHLSILNIFFKIIFYLFSPPTSLFMYAPILLLALIGFIWWPTKLALERTLLPLSFLLLLTHLCTMSTVGDFQYGPRYLLPAMPFISLGLVGFIEKIKASSWITASGTMIIAILSIAICSVGALQGVMYGQIKEHAWWPALNNFFQNPPEYPLLWPGFFMSVLALMLLYIYIYNNKARA